jgi:hypothetical protein
MTATIIPANPDWYVLRLQSPLPPAVPTVSREPIIAWCIEDCGDDGVVSTPIVPSSIMPSSINDYDAICGPYYFFAADESFHDTEGALIKHLRRIPKPAAA